MRRSRPQVCRAEQQRQHWRSHELHHERRARCSERIGVDRRAQCYFLRIHSIDWPRAVARRRRPASIQNIQARRWWTDAGDGDGCREVRQWCACKTASFSSCENILGGMLRSWQEGSANAVSQETCTLPTRSAFPRDPPILYRRGIAGLWTGLLRVRRVRRRRAAGCSHQ